MATLRRSRSTAGPLLPPSFVQQRVEVIHADGIRGRWGGRHILRGRGLPSPGSTVVDCNDYLRLADDKRVVNAVTELLHAMRGARPASAVLLYEEHPQQQKQQAPGHGPSSRSGLSALGLEPDQTPPPAPTAARGPEEVRARRSRRSNRAWQPSRSGWSGMARTGRHPARTRGDRDRRRGRAGGGEAGRMDLQK